MDGEDSAVMAYHRVACRLRVLGERGDDQKLMEALVKLHRITEMYDNADDEASWLCEVKVTKDE